MANAHKELGKPDGSRPYMAPEQLDAAKQKRRDKSADVSLAEFSKVDVFACGVILHELLTGIHPIGKKISQIWPTEHGKWKEARPWEKWAQKPSSRKLPTASSLSVFRPLVERSLEVDPAKRPSPAELKQDLMGELKRIDAKSYDSLLCLLTYFHFAAVSSAGLNEEDDARYQKKHLEALTKRMSDGGS